MATEGRSTVYNLITSPAKLNEVNPENIELENDYIEYLESIDRAKGTIRQYRANLHVFWCWNLEYNKNKFFVDLTKREMAKFQNHCINEWGWSPRRTRTVKATLSSLSNFIENILDDEFEGYKPIVRKIESPADEAVREKSVFQMEDMQLLLDTLVEMKEYEKACLVALAIYSGRRKAELARFKVKYFDDENLICGGALYKTPEKIVTKGRGSRGKLLEVYTLAKQFKPYFDLWMKQRQELDIKSEWLFPRYKDGKWIEDEYITISMMNSWAKSFSNILNRPMYLHSLRHFFTTFLLEQNLPESVVQSIMGWAKGSNMLPVYDDRSQESQLEKYFGADGIQQVESKGLNDL